MAALVRALAKKHTVLLFDSRPIVGYDFAGVVEVRAAGFRQAAAVASGCRALVAPDSAFVHLAGALALPCLGLFGPTDGALRTGDYPSCRFLDVRRSLRCIPCWRNEETACALTGMRTSVCLGEIAPAAVVAALEALLAETAAGSARSEGA
jgi:ADP-heptose:LPS heptosyltransferase